MAQANIVQGIPQSTSVRQTVKRGLSDAQCRNLVCPSDKERIRLFDGGGLYIEATQKSKRWFYKFRRPDGKETRLALGVYPVVTLKEARDQLIAAKLQLRSGVDPVRAKIQQRLQRKTAQANTFEVVANQWYQQKKNGWSTHHQIREHRNFTKDLNPWIGSVPVNEIDAPMLLEAVRRVEARGSLDVAHRVLSTARGILGYAVATGKVQTNCAYGLTKALTPHRGGHFGAIIKPADFGDLLRAIDSYAGGPVVRAALKLAPLLFQRPTELRAAQWSEMDLAAGLWMIPAKRMKRDMHGKEHGPDHLVPLSTQAVKILRELQRLTGDGTYLFPGERGKSRPISDNTMRVALQSMGYSSSVQTVHGFRASARTMLDEQLNVDIRVIEAQLAHRVKDANGEAYMRSKYVDKRVAMMQVWADYLDDLKAQSVARSLKLVA